MGLYPEGPGSPYVHPVALQAHLHAQAMYQTAQAQAAAETRLATERSVMQVGALPLALAQAEAVTREPQLLVPDKPEPLEVALETTPFPEIDFGLTVENELHIPLSIDYSIGLSELIAAGDYAYVSQDITAANFPWPKRWGEVIATLIHSDRPLNSEEALLVMKSEGLRPASIFELLTFGNQYPGQQHKYPIVALGSSHARHGGVRSYPMLVEDLDQRKVYVSSPGQKWSPNHRLLAVRGA